LLFDSRSNGGGDFADLSNRAADTFNRGNRFGGCPLIRACKADVDGPLGLLAALARRGAGFAAPDFDGDLRELDFFAAELLGISNLPSVREWLLCRSQI